MAARRTASYNQPSDQAGNQRAPWGGWAPGPNRPNRNRQQRNLSYIFTSSNARRQAKPDYPANKASDGRQPQRVRAGAGVHWTGAASH